MLRGSRCKIRHALGPLCLFVAAGCIGSESSERLIHVDSLPKFRLVEDLRIGNRDDPELGFSRVDEVDVDRDGFIYVFESLQREIRVFSPSGEWVRTIGGPGEGPGEFAGPRFSFGIIGDTVWVIDPMIARRITLFDRSGALVSTGVFRDVPVLLSESGPSASIVPFEMDQYGLFSGELGNVSFQGVAVDPPQGDPPLIPRIRFSADGAITDTTGMMKNPLAPGPGSLFLLTRAEEEVEAVAKPGSGEGNQFAIVRTDLVRDTIAVQWFRFDPMRDQDRTPDPVSLIRVGTDDAVWIRRENVETADSASWLVLDRDLSPLGEVRAPRTGFRIEWSQNDSILAVVIDSVGVPWVVRYRMAPAF